MKQALIATVATLAVIPSLGRAQSQLSPADVAANGRVPAAALDCWKAALAGGVRQYDEAGQAVYTATVVRSGFTCNVKTMTDKGMVGHMEMNAVDAAQSNGAHFLRDVVKDGFAMSYEADYNQRASKFAVSSPATGVKIMDDESSPAFARNAQIMFDTYGRPINAPGTAAGKPTL